MEEAFRLHFLGNLASAEGQPWKRYWGQEVGRAWVLLPYLSLPREASFAMATSPLQFQLLLGDAGLRALLIRPPPSAHADAKSEVFCCV